MQAWRYDAIPKMMLAGTLKPERPIGEHLLLSDAIPALTAMEHHAPDGIAVVDPRR